MEVEVAFDRDGEAGEAAVALDFPESGLGFEHPGGGPAQDISPELQFLTLRLIARTVEIIDSQGLVHWSVRLSCPVTPSRVTVRVSSMPSLE